MNSDESRPLTSDLARRDYIIVGVVIAIFISSFFLVYLYAGRPLPNPDQPEQLMGMVKDFILIFTSILYEALPFIILGAVLAGILEELVPQGLIPRLGLYAARFMKRRLPRTLFWILFPALRFFVRNRPLQIMLSAWLGLLFPMCECGIIPVMRRLLRKGLPLSCCVSYLLAGPIINIVVMISTYMAFYGREADTDAKTNLPGYQLGGIGMTFWRVTIGFLVAVGTSLVVEWQYRRHGNKLLAPLAIPGGALGQGDDADDDVWKVLRRIWSVDIQGRGRALWTWCGRRLSNIAETALHDFVDITFYLILGALLAALTRVMLDQEKVASLSTSIPVLAIVLTMELAILLCLCSEADAFVAAGFFAGLRPSAKLAFLTLGPMLDFKLYFMYTRVFRTRLILTIITCVVLQVFTYSIVFHYAYEGWVEYQKSTSVASAP
jgi:uncharacterized membrane protein YraQ (UPF0718 family)